MAQAQLTRDVVRPPDRRVRAVAVASGLAIAVGAVAMTVALVAAPGPWTGGYVSEAGVTGMPAATAYRSGLVLLAAGVVALGAAVSALPSGSASVVMGGRRVVRVDGRVAAILLVAAGLLAAASGTVPCSASCPLPPFEAASATDLVHGGSSILGMAALAFAMVAMALAPGLRPALRAWATAGAVATFPLAAVMAVVMLFVGRSPMGASTERIMLVVTVGWLIGAAALAAGRPAPDPAR
jgi:hypothetical protein